LRPAQAQIFVRARTPDPQPPPPRLPANPVSAPDLYNLYRTLRCSASMDRMACHAFQHVLTLAVADAYAEPVVRKL
jgi:hypothetical protein